MLLQPDFKDIFTDAFFSTHTDFSTKDEFLEAAGVEEKELSALENTGLNEFIYINTEYQNLSDLRRDTMMFWIKNQMQEE